MTKYDILKYYEIGLRDVENIIGVNSISNFRIKDQILIKYACKLFLIIWVLFHQIIYQE